MQIVICWKFADVRTCCIVSFYFPFQHSEDSWSEEGELSDDEESLQQPPCRQSYSAQSSEGVFSEEDTTSDQSGHKDGSGDGDNGHLSTGSTENLEAELSKCTCTSDGLSDRELTVQRMKNKVNSTDRIFEVSWTASSASYCIFSCHINWLEYWPFWSLSTIPGSNYANHKSSAGNACNPKQDGRHQLNCQYVRSIVLWNYWSGNSSRTPNVSHLI